MSAAGFPALLGLEAGFACQALNSSQGFIDQESSFSFCLTSEEN